MSKLVNVRFYGRIMNLAVIYQLTLNPYFIMKLEKRIAFFVNLGMLELSYRFKTLHDYSCSYDLNSVATLQLLPECPYANLKTC